MTQIIAEASPHAAPGAARARPEPLRRVRRIGYAVLALQFAGFAMWSLTLYDHFALTFDFAVYHQAWYLIAHGDLNPASSIARLPTVARLPFWQNDGEFAVWPLAPFYWIWPHDVLLLWLQDAGVAVAEAVAFTWLCEIAGRHRQGRAAAWLGVTGLVLLIANPWIWWAISFDFHEETLAIPFAVLLARDLANGSRRAWAWVVPILAAGAPSATYVIGIGLGSALALRRARTAGILLMLAGTCYSVLIVLIHADVGVPLARHYGYLATSTIGAYAGAKLTTGSLVQGIASHPLNIARALWAKRIDIIANLAPAGLLGIGWVEVLPLVAVVLLANTLSFGLRFAEPLFQSLPIYVLVPVGTITILGRLSQRHAKLASVVAVLLVAQAAGWMANWGPRTQWQWLRVPDGAAATLARIETQIPSSAEVIASQGVVGRFSGRIAVHELAGPGTTPITSRTVWFVIGTAAGNELQSTASAIGLIGKLAGPLHATLVTHANGIWAFRWHPPATVHTMSIPGNSVPLPAWAAPVAPGATGHPVLTGPVSTWHLASAGGSGYVADELAWQEPAARYQVRLTLSATAAVTVEVWNDNGDVLLARRTIPGTSGIESVIIPVDAASAYHAILYSGWGPFRADFAPPSPGQRLEVRVWSSGTSQVNVYRAAIAQARGGAGQSTVK
ncbi:MAG TPA: DUF2079 domain-containing protein [Streptosporangiaceae bacterium]|nr:DUF2079 domain-containing protein [Streptosporangiaceae bacterium]